MGAVKEIRTRGRGREEVRTLARHPGLGEGPPLVHRFNTEEYTSHRFVKKIYRTSDSHTQKIQRKCKKKYVTVQSERCAVVPHVSLSAPRGHNSTNE